MPPFAELIVDQPQWIWAAVAAILLAAELATGSGWLLWPAASAGVVALVEGLADLSAPLALALFAGLTIVSTATARRYFPRRLSDEGQDINDMAGRLLGREGEAVSAFHGRDGRVFVDGKGWAAELAEGDGLSAGSRVQVVGVADARLTVRPVRARP